MKSFIAEYILPFVLIVIIATVPGLINYFQGATFLAGFLLGIVSYTIGYFVLILILKLFDRWI